MLKLGIIGAENSHSVAVGKTFNIDHLLPVRVPVIWGETSAFARTAAEKGAIPEIVRDWRELLGRVDGVMIDHRHPAPHAEPARFFIEHGVPTFVDKPFTGTLRAAKALLDLAERRRCPVMTFSAIPIQSTFAAFKKALLKAAPVTAVNATGPVDLKSRYGGVFFYGIHQVDALVELLGTDVHSVVLARRQGNGVGALFFRDGRVATLNCLKQNHGGFAWQAATASGVIHHLNRNDPNPYASTCRLIHRFLRNGTHPFSRERMLAPIAILEALQKSLDRGGRLTKVAAL